MSGDIIHHGHINILKIASSYGNVILGALTDKAIKSYKKTNHKLQTKKINLRFNKIRKK